VPEKQNTYKGIFPKHKYKTIYLNIKHLDIGEYQLKIVLNNKIIKKTTFKK